jgi:hypothetical protein
MKKKAQITMFIIIGLIFLMLFAYIFYISKIKYELKVSDNTGFNPYFKSCIDSHIEQGIYEMGLYSGYLTKPTRFEISTIENSKEELKTYIENRMKLCINTYPRNENIKINFKIPTINIEILDKIIVNIQDSYTYNLNNQQITSPDFSFSYDVRYMTVYNTAKDIIEQNQEFIHDNDNLKQDDLVIKTSSVFDGQLWLITDKISDIKSDSFYFAFKK